MCIMVNYYIIHQCDHTHPLKLVDRISSTYANINKENHKGDLELEVGNQIKIIKYKFVFANCCIPIWSE